MFSRQHRSEIGAPIQLWLLVGAMALIELVLSGADQGWFGSPDWREIAFEYGAFWRPLLSGQASPLYPAQPYLMFITYAFLHGSPTHFLLNGVVILALGKFIADRVGPWPVILLFFVSALAGGLVFGLMARTQAPMIGASGAAFGFIGFWQYWEVKALRARGRTLRPVLSLLAGLVVVNVVLDVALGGALAWQAHLGGFIAGVAMAPVMNWFERHRLGR